MDNHRRQRGRVNIMETESTGNGGDGIHVGPDAVDVHIVGVKTRGNKRHGIHISEQPEEPQDNERGSGSDWYKKPIGQIGIGVAVVLISAAAVWAIQHYFS